MSQEYTLPPEKLKYSTFFHMIEKTSASISSAIESLETIFLINENSTGL
jgi:hypothetical protein